MKALIFALIVSTGCTALPTAPSPPNAALSDSRYDAAFMASFTQSWHPQSLVVFVYDEDGLQQPVPADTIRQAMEAAASLQQALGIPVDVRPRRGAAPGEVIRGLSVLWMNGAANIGGMAPTLVPNTAFVNYKAATFEVCGGLAKTVVRHELMHAMGFQHTDDPGELMFPEVRYCDRLPSARETFHARVALGVE